MRIGHGYDAHRFAKAEKPLVLGGVPIPSHVGLEAHSDGDVLLHAFMDALLGAAGERDIGHQFPDTDPAYKDADSRALLSKTMAILEEDGFSLMYADMTIIAQEPKLAPYIESMRREIAAVLGVEEARVNVKATTEEKMGFTGRGEGIAVHAVCLLSESGDSRRP